MRISLDHLCKSFDGVEVLRDITFDEEVSALAIIGPSGGGKSTLLRIIGGLETPTSGAMAVDGSPVSLDETSLRAYRATLGFVFQDGGLFHHMTALENVALPLQVVHGASSDEADDRARELLARLGLEDSLAKRPAQLSGGQKQRVAIAGVIAMQPKCIVLDEPTAMLDPSGRREVIDTATKLCREQGITVVLITHHMEECVGADRVIVLSNGAVVADGAPKQVFPQVDLLQKEGLTAPVTVRLLDALRAHGMDVPIDALTVSDCADAVAAALKK